MKHLVLVRHAKSSWANANQRDVHRPLNERGLRNAPDMGSRILAHGPFPERIISSHAQRALHTAQLIADAADYPRGHIEIVEEIYEASPETLLAVLRAQPDSYSRLMLVGHNPGLTELAARLCPAARIANIPTCGVLYLDLEQPDWASTGRNVAARWEFDYPKRPAG